MLIIGFLFLILFLIFIYNISEGKKEDINYILILLFLLISTNQLLIFEEEIILILVVLLLLDASGGLIKEVVWGLLEEKGVIIEKKLQELFELKITRLNSLYNLYQTRKNSDVIFLKVYFDYLYEIVDIILLLNTVEKEVKILEREKIVFVDYLLNLVKEENSSKLSWVLAVLDDNFDDEFFDIIEHDENFYVEEDFDSEINESLLEGIVPDEDLVYYYFYLYNLRFMYDLVEEEEEDLSEEDDEKLSKVE
jgi:hypothetical protein